jgi:BioD-like phosphotransacetylase family protein
MGRKGDLMPPVIVYITGFRQHAGKTVAALGIISALKKVIDPARIGYIKPVGQEMIALESGQRIDKDALILKIFSGIPELDLEYLSPVRLLSGFTRKYLDAPDRQQETANLKAQIQSALEQLAGKDVIIAEATGHPGVGSIVGLSNAKVSNLMKAEIVFLSGGGIGKAMDQLEVDLSYFLFKRSRVRGIIFNKVMPEKLPAMKQYVNEELINSKLDAVGAPIRVFGYIPDLPDLGKPSMQLIYRRWPKAEALGDTDLEQWKLPCQDIKVISLPEKSLRRPAFLNAGDLVIMSSLFQKRSRSLLKFNKTLKAQGRGLGGLILTGGNYMDLDPQVKADIAASGLPGLFVPEHTAICEEKLLKIYANTKLQIYDKNKVMRIESLFREHFDLDRFMDTMNIRP